MLGGFSADARSCSTTIRDARTGDDVASGVMQRDRGSDRIGVVHRQCSRTGCSDRAEVTLTYHYGRSQVWLDDLSPERDPHAYDLCDRHAERLSVPAGWYLDDRRFGRHALIAV